MSTVSFHIANLLEKMTSNDKDFRFMATNDLMSELQKDSIKLDDDSERKVVRMLLKLLEDKNGEVQNLAVKCLGPLVDKVKEPQVETIVDTLCTNMTGDKEQLRDISSIGLKTVITELPLTSQQLASVICKKIIGKLTQAISKQEDVTVQLEALDILGDLLSRFGSILQQYHAMLLDALLPQLSSNRQAVRKRTVVALGHLAASCSSAHYLKMVTILVEEMKKGLESNPLQANTQIQCCATVCKNSGSRFAEYLNQVVIMLMNACNKNDDDELKENTLQAFEVFVSRCPQELGTGDHLEGILMLCVRLISHDPNYNDEDQNNFNPMNEESMDCDDEDDDLQNDQDDQEEDEYSDDDDMSWKVRRAAAKCIEAVIASRPDLLLFVYKNVSIPLISRFREREENVRCDVFSAYRSLLRATKPAVLALNEARLTGLPPSNHSLVAVQFLENQIPQLVKIVQKQLKEKNIKSRQVALQVLAELVGVLPGCLSPYLATMMNGILICLSDRNSTSNVRTNTLSFLYVIMSSHPIEVIQPHVQVLLPVLLTCVGDNFYKVTSEALSTLQVLIKIIRSAEPGATEHPNASELTRLIYPVVLHRLKATDIDQEVKETAITTTATLLAHLGNYIQSEWQNCIPIFLERLKNEITRLTAVKALNLMASSKLVDLDLRSVLSEAIPVLSSFLRKNQRALKLVTLNLIDTLMIRYGPMDAMLLENVIQELPSLLSESDLHCAQQALQLMTSLAIYQPHVVERAGSVCLPSIKVLVRSPLMQGAALNALMQFLQALVKANIATFTSQRLLAIFLEQEVSSSPTKELLGAVHHKQSFYSLAKCISVISVGSGDQNALNVANGFVGDLNKLNTLTDTQVVIALLSIGEIGRHVDLSQLQMLRETILQCFSHSSEEVKTAAAHSFGSVAIGNLPVFLPALLNEMKQQPKKQYLLLHALKEIISAQHGVNISNWTEDIWAALFAHAECSEEGTRNVVAECLGRLTLASPEKFLPRLKNALQSHSNLLRTTSISAVKFTIVDQPQMIDPILKETIGDFLKSLADPDLNVRRVALVAFNSAAHNKPALIRDLLPELLPQLYIETQIRKELIREVEMGPFRHSVDDGLDLRKAAFECMYTLLDSCLDRLDIRDFLTNVENGLRDHYDIKMLTYLMVARLAALCPSHVVQRLDRLIEPLKNTVTLKVKANSVKQEYEKQDELKRAALRAVSALSSIPDADKHIQLMEFVAHIRNNQDLQALYDSVQSDTLSAANNDAHMVID